MKDVIEDVNWRRARRGGGRTKGKEEGKKGQVKGKRDR
jgi:hypothetical protein